MGAGKWKEFVSDEGRFSVLMPGVPSATINERETADGRITFRSFAVKLPEAFYQVGYSDFPAASDDQILAGVRDLLSAQKGAQVLSERKIKIAHLQGSEWWVVQNGVALGIRRAVAIGGRLYQVNMLVPLERAFKNGRPSLRPEDQTQLFTSLRSRFFDSFKLRAD